MARTFLSVCLCLALAASVSASDDGILQGLEADEVCQAGASAGDCSLELRQLRAAQMKVATEAEAQTEQTQKIEEAAASEEGSKLIGPDAEGQDMWQETTWSDVIADLQINQSAEGSSCDTETGGTCSLLSCAASRGATRCVSGACKCAPGYCAKGGSCFPSSPASCVADTGGTCSVTSCKSSRGDTKCKAGTCLCKTGGCAWKGACFAATDTGGSCSVLPCGLSRGPTTCHRGRCLCKDKYVAVAGMCVAM